MKPTIFLDMDGVLADFIGHAAAEFGVDLERAPRVYDLPQVLGLSSAVIHARIWDNGTFWETIPVLPWARELVTELRKLGGVYLLTTPWPRCNTCIVEKRLWAYTHLGIDPVHVLVADHKSAYAQGQYDHILIDDYELNCASWGASGGYAALFPARHNRLRDQLKLPPGELVQQFMQFHFAAALTRRATRS